MRNRRAVVHPRAVDEAIVDNAREHDCRESQRRERSFFNRCNAVSAPTNRQSIALDASADTPRCCVAHFRAAAATNGR